MDKERKVFLEALKAKSIQVDLIDILKNTDLKNPKSAEASAVARKKGNDLLLKHKSHNAETHKEIFSHYCESIASAPNESQELALAYGNRSYLLLHMHKYEECIEDIDRALKLSNSDVLKAKLLCRKAECRKRLGSPRASSILKMVQIIAENINGQDKMKILKMIDAVKALNIGAKKEGMSSIDLKSKADYNLAVTDDYSSCVSIEYSEKYGRHLVAAKDYKPGDIIFVEKMYASTFIEGSSLLACDHCLKPLWSSIPCSNCNWAMYCSESCKEEAWNEYHDIDCTAISHLRQLKEWAKCTCSKKAILALRMLILGLKETGGIANLKKEIELLDQCADGSSRDFLKNGQLPMSRIGSVYSLPSSLDSCYCDIIKHATIIPCILICLSKHSKLKDDFNLREIKDLKMNKDIMFLGKLLIRLIAVINVCEIPATYDGSEIDSKLQNDKSMIVDLNAKRCLGIVLSLLNRSCFPSANWCCTESNKIIVHALQPIKKHSQIFIQFRNGFEHELQSVRQAKFREKYNFTCECRACVESWPPIQMNGVYDGDVKERILKDIKKGEYSFEDVKFLNREVVNVLREGRQVDKLHVKKLSALITRAMHWKQPSFMFSNMIRMLKDIFDSIYSPQPLVFNECHQID